MRILEQLDVVVSAQLNRLQYLYSLNAWQIDSISRSLASHDEADRQQCPVRRRQHLIPWCA